VAALGQGFPSAMPIAQFPRCALPSRQFLGIIAESSPIGRKLLAILSEVRYVEENKTVGLVGRYSHFGLAPDPGSGLLVVDPFG
jgi:hypothetical protein